MNKAYKNVKLMLADVRYHFEHENAETDITLNTSESIVINSVSDDNINFTAERKLIFTGLQETYLSVVYNVNLPLNKKISKSQFTKDIKKGLPVLSGIFIEISLMIAQISDKCPFGAIITPPMYDKATIEVS